MASGEAGPIKGPRCSPSSSFLPPLRKHTKYKEETEKRSCFESQEGNKIEKRFDWNTDTKTVHPERNPAAEDKQDEE